MIVIFIMRVQAREEEKLKELSGSNNTYLPSVEERKSESIVPSIAPSFKSTFVSLNFISICFPNRMRTFDFLKLFEVAKVVTKNLNKVVEIIRPF